MTKLKLEIVKNSLGCIINDYDIDADNIDSIGLILGLEPGCFHPAATYDLNNTEFSLLNSEFSLNTSLEDDETARIRQWRAFDKLPYKVHTNRELFLMLEGLKPLAVFVERISTAGGVEVIPDRYFLPFVEKGVINRHEFFFASLNLHYVMFTLPNEDWRANAYFLLKSTGEKCTWSEQLERMEGALLGYSDSQNDYFIEHIYKSQVK